eukprot:scaffold83883_cov62-Attheya_sp.AAC.1
MQRTALIQTKTQGTVAEKCLILPDSGIEILDVPCAVSVESCFHTILWTSDPRLFRLESLPYTGSTPPEETFLANQCHPSFAFKYFANF